MLRNLLAEPLACYVKSFYCVLWVTYVAIPCTIPECYGDIGHRSFISLNFAGILSKVARISTQLLMMSCGENAFVKKLTNLQAIWHKYN